MQVTSVTISSIVTDDRGKTRAYARVVLDGTFVLTRVNIVDGSNGLFVAYPADPDVTGADFHSMFYPVDQGLRDHIELMVLAKYYEAVEAKDPVLYAIRYESLGYKEMGANEQRLLHESVGRESLEGLQEQKALLESILSELQKEIELKKNRLPQIKELEQQVTDEAICRVGEFLMKDEHLLHEWALRFSQERS